MGNKHGDGNKAPAGRSKTISPASAAVNGQACRPAARPLTALIAGKGWPLRPAARELLEVIEDRVQIRATLITSQLPLEKLHTAIADPTVADAILNRLVHHAHKLSLKGESMRKVSGPSKSNQGEEEKPRRR